MLVVTLLAGGCPLPAIVFAFGLDERTVQAWQMKAGQHAQQVQAERVCAGRLELGQVQGDKLYLKTQHGAAWMATAMCVFSRLFLWGEVSVERSTSLIERVVARVRDAAKPDTPILWVTDGFSAWAKAVRRIFRRPHYTGKPGRPALRLWPQVHLVQVVKHKVGRRLVSIERRLCLGHWVAAQEILCWSQTQLGVFNTAYIERLNATFRTWIPALTRRSRMPSRHRLHLEAAMFWTGCVYNFCRVHATLEGTPAMAAGLTEEVWSVRELLFCFAIRPELLHANL